MDDRIQEYRQLRPDTFLRIEEGLRCALDCARVPELEDGRIAEMVGAELARLRDPGAAHAFDRPWWGAEPLLAGDRIRLQLSDDGPPREAVVRRPGWTGGCSRHDMVELEWVAEGRGREPGEPVERISGLRLAGRVHRAAWSDERLREVERARASSPRHRRRSRSRARGTSSKATCCAGPRWRDRTRRRRRAPAWAARRSCGLSWRWSRERRRRPKRRTTASFARYGVRTANPAGELSLSLDMLAAFAPWRAFPDSEEERWSRAQARKMELDEKRVELNQRQGRHYVMRL